MPTARVILVGGFLGSGKTTLLAQAAEHLARQGKRVGLIANDQAADLVDSEILKETGSQVEEVAGGCFCCRFPDMIGAMERLVRDSGAQVLIGEPVGSCTDLSATVMQPLKKLHGDQFAVAPFSVLIDVKQVRVLARLRQRAAPAESPRFPDNVLYIYEKQLEEADLIVLNKADLLPAGELAELHASLAERFPDTPLMTISALTGEGVDAWLDYVSRDQPAGRKIAAVDYDTYAAGEASLGWLNAAAKLHSQGDIDWQTFAADLLEAIRGALPPVGRNRPPQALPVGPRRRRGGQRDQQRRPRVGPRRTGCRAAARLPAHQRPRPRPTGRSARNGRKGLADHGRRAAGGQDHQHAEFLSRPASANPPL